MRDFITFLKASENVRGQMCLKYGVVTGHAMYLWELLPAVVIYRRTMREYRRELNK